MFVIASHDRLAFSLSVPVTEFLNEYGFVVIRCLSPEECAASVTALFADINSQAAATQKQKILPVRSPGIYLLKLACVVLCHNSSSILALRQSNLVLIKLASTGRAQHLGERELAQSSEQVPHIEPRALAAGVQQPRASQPVSGL